MHYADSLGTGKGKLQTFFVRITDASKASDVSETLDLDSNLSSPELLPDANTEKMKRLIEWNVQVLSSLLRSVIARRMAIAKRLGATKHVILSQLPTPSGMVLDEVKGVISLPPFNADTLKRQVDPEKVELDPVVVEQLYSLVSWIASMYRLVGIFQGIISSSAV